MYKYLYKSVSIYPTGFGVYYWSGNRLYIKSAHPPFILKYFKHYISFYFRNPLKILLHNRLQVFYVEGFSNKSLLFTNSCY